jgi:orotidine-5'-phosphate decarboxylase
MGMKTMSDRTTLLYRSADRSGTLLCVGLDPRIELIRPDGGTSSAGRANEEDVHYLERHYRELLNGMERTGLAPAAFKPNIAYFHRLDRPLSGYFGGSRLLADLLGRIRQAFPGVPVILDAKRADIAATSDAYAEEALECWGAQAVTVSPFLGDDSVEPFVRRAAEAGKWIYLLTRTSNAGASRFQDLRCGEQYLYDAVADAIIEWNGGSGTVGAVIGATAPAELGRLLDRFNGHNIPVLLPGVGAQGASAAAVLATVKRTGYPPWLVRVNVSRHISTPGAAGDGPGTDTPSARSDVSPVEAAFRHFHGALAWR